MVVADPNDLLRRARQRTESPYARGDCLSRQELAELVNVWVYEHTENHQVIELDANYIGQLKRGKIRWPQNRTVSASARWSPPESGRRQAGQVSWYGNPGI